jgi:hypothetical protein
VLLFGRLPANPRSTGLVLLMSVASLLVFAATILHPVLALAWLLGAIVLCNMFIMAFLRHDIHETFIATAGLGRMIPAHRLPAITTGKTIELIDGFHPLLAAPVANSIALRGQSALVVGTNMAGKTTFIKMVGTNIILGRTLGVCFAATAVVPRSNVMALIRAEHSIESGKSHFLAELERILSFVQRAERDGRGVFVMDELFRGTNTPERVAAGKAVLESLGAHAQVLVTTHDIELQHLLGPTFRTFHFVEDPELPEVFDYRLHPGISTTKNAIKLLEKVGLVQQPGGKQCVGRCETQLVAERVCAIEASLAPGLSFDRAQNDGSRVARASESTFQIGHGEIHMVRIR